MTQTTQLTPSVTIDPPDASPSSTVARMFGRLLLLRWSSQATDGLFQSGLASFLLFSPERAPTAVAVAGGFALVLLPYSLIGPLVGTLLDRFQRRSLILVANLIRSLLLGAIAWLIAAGTTEAGLIPWVLVCFGLSRLVLAGLSAGLPRVVEPEVLVRSNAIAVTGGTVAAVIGGGIGFAIRHFHDGGADQTDAIIIALASAAYALAGMSALTLKRTTLGPMDHEKRSLSLRHGMEEVRLGLAALAAHPLARWSIVRIGAARGGISALIVTSILLQRGAFTSSADAALAGLAVIVTLMGVGALIGAAITPRATRRWSRRTWMRGNLAGAIFLAALFPLIATPLTLAPLMMCMAAVAQAIKVSADAEVQLNIDDDFRGRVFAVYDMSVNVAIVIGAFLAAMVLPDDGRSMLLPWLVAGIWSIIWWIDRHASRERSAHH